MRMGWMRVAWLACFARLTRRRLDRTSLPLALGSLFDGALLRHAPALLLHLLARLLFFDPASILGFEAFALAPLGLGALTLSALRLFGFALLRIELFLLRARLTLEHV